MNRLFLIFLLLVPLQVARTQELQFQTGHTHDILTVEFSPDDKQLVSYSAGDGRLCLWEVRTGHLLWMTKTEVVGAALSEFYWSEAGDTLVTKSRTGNYQTWNATTGKILSLGGMRPDTNLASVKPKTVALTKDYDKISVAGRDTAAVKEIKRFGNNSAFATSNDGTMIAEGGSWGDACIRITEIESGKSWWLDGHPSVIGAISFNADGKLLAVGGSDKNIYLFAVGETPRLVRVLVGHTKPVNSLAFSADGLTLLSTAHGEDLKIWDVATGSVVKKIGPEFWLGFSQVKFSPDGKFFLTVNDWSGLNLWESSSGKVIRKFCLDEKNGYDCGSKAVSVSFTGDGRKIVAGYENGTIKVWDLKQPKPVVLERYGTEDVYVAAMANGNVLAASNAEDFPVKQFLPGLRRETKRYTADIDGFVENLALSPRGTHFATATVGGDVYLWDVARSKPVHELDIGFSGNDALAFSPDGKALAVGGRNQNLFLFDVATGNKLWQLITSYQTNDLEDRLGEERRADQRKLEEAETRRDQEAAIDTEKLKHDVSITFDHYGFMTDPGEQRMLESGEPKNSKDKKSAADSNAVWLRLHNDSPLPISVPTQSMYLPNPKCFFEFSPGNKVFGLCDGREIAVWFGVDNQKGIPIPYGFDFGSHAILLPKTSALFAVPRAVFENGNAIRFEFVFLKDDGANKVRNYGTPKPLKFRESDLPLVY